MSFKIHYTWKGKPAHEKWVGLTFECNDFAFCYGYAMMKKHNHLVKGFEVKPL